MPQNRLYFAVKAIGIAPFGSNAFVAVKGAQSVGINTNFNLEQVFELGQLAIYENIENIPDIECTIERVLDGTTLAYHLATRGYASGTLAGRANRRCNVALSLFSDENDSASGVQRGQVDLSGMYLSSAGYQFPVDGNFTESVTLVGNNKVWRSSGFTFTGGFLNTDTPVLASGGVNRREDLIFTGQNSAALDTNNQVAATNCTILPPDIQGINASGLNVPDSLGNYPASVQNISVTCDLGRDQIDELGHKAPYFRYVNFPVEVKTDIEIISKSGDFVAGTDTGINSDGTNLTNRTIKIKAREGIFINLGTKNKLNSVTMGGADAGGGNETITYSYTTFNDFTIEHPQDPL